MLSAKYMVWIIFALLAIVLAYVWPYALAVFALLAALCMLAALCTSFRKMTHPSPAPKVVRKSSFMVEKPADASHTDQTTPQHSVPLCSPKNL